MSVKQPLNEVPRFIVSYIGLGSLTSFCKEVNVYMEIWWFQIYILDPILYIFMPEKSFFVELQWEILAS